MTLSREEIAVRLACADVQGSSLPPDKDRAVWAAQVVATTDAIGAALTHTPAPVAPPAGKYVPAVGDFVTWGSCTAMWRVLRVDSGGVYAVFAEKRNYTSEPRYLDPRECETLRLATPSELAAAGLAVPPPAPMPAPDAPPYRGADCLNMIGAVVDYFGQSFIVTSHGKSQLLGFPDALASGHVTPSAITFLRWATDEERKQHRIPTPAPEAKRPTHVRVTREIPSWSGGDRIEAGTVFPVERWEGANGGYPFVKPTGRNGFILHPREWEPCAAPPAPESKRDEAVRCAERAVVEAAEAVYANGYGFAKDRLLDAVEALRRAREAGLCEGGSK